MTTFSFDAESNGLWGRTFALAAIVYDGSGNEIARFVGRCPIQGEINPWVKDNVLPQLASVPETHASYEVMLSDFARFYLQHKQEAELVVHMGVPVEARILLDMHALGVSSETGTARIRCLTLRRRSRRWEKIPRAWTPTPRSLSFTSEVLKAGLTTRSTTPR